VKGVLMEIPMQCYLVRETIVPDLLGRTYLETYFIAKTDRDAIMDSFRHAAAIIETYSIRVEKLEVFEYSLGVIVEGVYQGGINRMLYDSERLEDSIVQELPIFVG
jgi:hypothetical protein